MHVSRRDGAILCGLGALCLASYEAMIYLGPFLAAATLWSMVRGPAKQSTDSVARLLGWVAAFERRKFPASAVAIEARCSAQLPPDGVGVESG